MERLKSYEQFNAILRNLKQNCVALDSNCYLTGDLFRRAIDLGNMYYLPLTAGIVCLWDCGYKYAVLCWLSAEQQLCLPSLEKPQVAEIVYRQYADNIDKALENKLISAGFELHACLHDYANPVVDEGYLNRADECCRNIRARGFSLGELKPQQSTEAMDLLQQVIDPYDIHALNDQDWERFISVHDVFAATDSHGTLAAVTILPNSFRSGLTGVLPRYRGMSLGIGMKYFPTAFCYRQGWHKSSHVWIADHNMVNRHIVEKEGRQLTGKYAVQYVHI